MAPELETVPLNVATAAPSFVKAPAIDRVGPKVASDRYRTVRLLAWGMLSTQLPATEASMVTSAPVTVGQIFRVTAPRNTVSVAMLNVLLFDT